MSSQFDTFAAALSAARRAPGVILFTATVIADGGASMARVYTTHPEVYPVGGRKSLAGDTDPGWLQRVVVGRQPFLGADAEALRAIFFDAATIESLGCGAIVNVPVLSNGHTIGSMNFLGRQGDYDDRSVDAAMDVARRSVALMERALATS